MLHTNSGDRVVTKVTEIAGTGRSAAIAIIMAGLDKAPEDFLQRLVERGMRDQDNKWLTLAAGEFAELDPNTDLRSLRRQCYLHSSETGRTYHPARYPDGTVGVTCSDGFDPSATKGQKYGFDTLEVGSRILVAVNDNDKAEVNRVRSSAKMYARRHGIRLSTSVVEGGMKVERIA